jgi:hypothetical protein
MKNLLKACLVLHVGLAAAAAPEDVEHLAHVPPRP